MTNIETPVTNSLLGELKANRQRIEARKHVELQIPGWDSLYVRYRALPWETLRTFEASTVENPTPNDELAVAWDTLIAACEEVLIKNEDGSLSSLDSTPVAFEQRLARLTGDDVAETPHDVIASIFPNEFALMQQLGEYIEWLNFSSTGSYEELGKA
jgi:hypothetical protein